MANYPRWPKERNEFRKIAPSATYHGAMNKFHDLTDEKLKAGAKQAYLANEGKHSLESLIARAESIRSDGLAIINAAFLAYPKRRLSPARPGLPSMTADESSKVRKEIGLHLELAEYDLSTGRIFQASWRVACARVALKRRGERYLK